MVNNIRFIITAIRLYLNVLSLKIGPLKVSIPDFAHYFKYAIYKLMKIDICNLYREITFRLFFHLIFALCLSLNLKKEPHTLWKILKFSQMMGRSNFVITLSHWLDLPVMEDLILFQQRYQTFQTISLISNLLMISNMASTALIC
jgi:hypothetical protein